MRQLPGRSPARTRSRSCAAGRRPASTLFFAALVLLLFGFALGPDSRRLADAAPGLLWLAIVFGGLLSVARLHQLEADDGALEQLALYPVDRRAIYAGKALAGLAAMLVLGGVLLPVVAILYGIAIGRLAAAARRPWCSAPSASRRSAPFYAGLTVRMRHARSCCRCSCCRWWRRCCWPPSRPPPRRWPAIRSASWAPGSQLLAAFDVVMIVAGAGDVRLPAGGLMKTPHPRLWSRWWRSRPPRSSPSSWCRRTSTRATRSGSCTCTSRRPGSPTSRSG